MHECHNGLIHVLHWYLYFVGYSEWHFKLSKMSYLSHVYKDKTVCLCHVWIRSITAYFLCAQELLQNNVLAFSYDVCLIYPPFQFVHLIYLRVHAACIVLSPVAAPVDSSKIFSCPHPNFPHNNFTCVKIRPYLTFSVWKWQIFVCFMHIFTFLPLPPWCWCHHCLSQFLCEKLNKFSH